MVDSQAPIIDVSQRWLAEREAVLTLLWSEFEGLFPTDADSLEEFYRIAMDQHLLQCHHCGHSALIKKFGERAGVCRKCKKKSWFTAGTLFERIKRPKAWLAAIWLLERGMIISSSRLHKLAGIAQSSALNILKKLAAVIESRMDHDATTLPSSLFLAVMCKRSRETPARTHPRGEQDEIDESFPEADTVDNLNEAPTAGSFCLTTDLHGSTTHVTADSEPGITSSHSIEVQPMEQLDTLNEQERAVYDLLSEVPVSADSLCQRIGMSAADMSVILIMFELEGIARRLPGDHYVGCLQKPTNSVVRHSAQLPDFKIQDTALIGAFAEFIRLYFHGISRKYLQKYLATFWCHLDRTRWQVGSLVTECLNSRPIFCVDILSSVSPPWVKMMPSL